MNNMGSLDDILTRYQTSFSQKIHAEENEDYDVLMDVFGITPELKRENKQYWGRELGKCWESLVIESCKGLDTFQSALKNGVDEPCDLRVGKYAIDTKYRIGSGDSGTLKKFRQYGSMLQDEGYIPVFLFLREDNLKTAVSTCKKAGWEIYIGQESFDFIKEISGFDLQDYLIRKVKMFKVKS